MTKEELEKEARQKALEWNHKKINGKYNRPPIANWSCFEKGYLAGAEPREKQIAELSKHILELQKDKGELIDRCRELEAQIEKMKKYGKLLQDICVVLGNDNFMVAVQLESVVKKLWDASEEKEGLKMVEDIENRLLKIKPQEWAEINEWEIKEK